MHILLAPSLPPSNCWPGEDSTKAPKSLNRTCKPNFPHEPQAFLWLTYNRNKSVMLFSLLHRERVLLIIIVIVLCSYIVSILYDHLMIFLLPKKILSDCVCFLLLFLFTYYWSSCQAGHNKSKFWQNK